MAWIIVNKAHDSLAWSNEFGWTTTDFDMFDATEHKTLRLPFGGEWREIEQETL